MTLDERSEALRARIEAAFAAVPLPRPEQFIEFDCLDEIWFAREMAGRTRGEIPESELNRLSESLFFIPPQVALYYLPMFMTWLIPARETVGFSTFGTVVSYLDPRNDFSLPEFNEEQLGCIAAFLEYLRDHADEYEGETDDALELKASLGAIHEHWTGLVASLQRARALREQIEAAFADIPLPRDEDFAVGDGLDECWCRDELEGLKRHDIPEEALERLGECLSYIQPQAVLYYLPVWMLDLLPPREDGAAFSRMQGYFDRRQNQYTEYPPFSREQVACIVEFVRYLRDYVRMYEWDQDYARRLEPRLGRILEAWIEVARSNT